MKILKLILALYIVHCALNITAQAQVRQDRSIIRGDVASITLKYPADITADSLFFQVRNSSSYNSTLHIEKKNTIAGGSTSQIAATYSYPYTTVTVYFLTANTSGMAIANYYYDLRGSVYPDSSVLVYGTFKVQSYEGEVVNNLGGTGTGGLSESIVKSWISDSIAANNLDLADYMLESSFSDSLLNWDLLYGPDSTSNRTFSDLKYADKNDFIDSVSTLRSLIGTSVGNDTVISGSAIIQVGADSVIVTHGLASTPLIQNINVTPQEDVYGFDYWVEDITSTTFKIKIGGTGYESLTSAVSFSWQVFNASLAVSGGGYVTFESYGGAVGDGVTNDSAAVVNTLNSGLKIKGTSGKTYLVNNASVITITDKNIDLSSTGLEPFTIRFNNMVDGFYFKSTLKEDDFILKDSVVLGARKLVLTSTTNVEVGDVITLTGASGDYWTGSPGFNYEKYELHLVDSLNADTVFISMPSWDTYDAYDDSHPTTVRVATPITVRMKNVNFEYIGSQRTDALHAITSDYSKFDIYEDVQISNARIVALHLRYNYGSKITGLRVFNSNYAGQGYGVDLSGSYGCEVSGGYFFNCRGSIDGGTFISRSNHIFGNIIAGNEDIVASRGLGPHAPSENWLIENNIIDYAYNGMNVEGRGHKYINNVFSNITNTVFYVTGAENVTISGNIVHSGAKVAPFFVFLESTVGNDASSMVTITNNKAHSVSRCFVALQNNHYNLTVVNNEMSFTLNPAYLIYDESATLRTHYNANIYNNNITRTKSGTTGYNAYLTNSSTFVTSKVEFREFNKDTTTVYHNFVLDGDLTASSVHSTDLYLDNLSLGSGDWIEKIVASTSGDSLDIVTGTDTLRLATRVIERFDNAETKTYIQSLSERLTLAQKSRIDTFITKVKDSLGITTLDDVFDFMYLMANETSEAARHNLVNRNHDATVVLAPNFVVNEGYTSYGTGFYGYLNSNYNPYTDSVNYHRDSASLGVYCRTNTNTSEYVIGSGSVTSNMSMVLRSSVSGFKPLINTQTNIEVANTDSRGFYVAVRSSADTVYGYKNGLEVVSSGTNTSTPFNDLDFFIGASNVDPSVSVSTQQFAFAFAGTELSATQVAKLNNCIEWYMDDLGKGVQ